MLWVFSMVAACILCMNSATAFRLGTARTVTIVRRPRTVRQAPVLHLSADAEVDAASVDVKGSEAEAGAAAEDGESELVEDDGEDEKAVAEVEPELSPLELAIKSAEADLAKELAGAEEELRRARLEASRTKDKLFESGKSGFFVVQSKVSTFRKDQASEQAKRVARSKREFVIKMLPVVDAFDLNGSYTHTDGIKLTYASFMPETNSSKIPLIIWLHGGGEGGTDPSIAILANKAYNYAAPAIQRHFGAAAVLAPQTPTRWMHGVSGNSTRGQEDDIYHKAIMGLVDQYVKVHPNIDKNRIYVGGCSNGGYMSLKLLIENPSYFAAGYISSLAYFDEFVSDKDLLKLKNIPIWLVHSQDDKTTVADKTATPLYHRLIKSGARNVHYSLFDHVIDITGQYGGSSYHYNGHWSWVYLHDNQVFLDFDGSPVTVKGKAVSIMEWMAAQKKK